MSDVFEGEEVDVGAAIIAVEELLPVLGPLDADGQKLPVICRQLN